MGQRSSDKRSTKSPGGPARTGGKRARRIKTGGSVPAAVPGTSGDPAAAEFESWMMEQFARADALARDYHDDFLKSRKKDPLNAGVRARIRTKLDSYAKRLEKLSTAYENPPDALLPFLTHLAATARGAHVLGIFSQIATLLEEIRRAIESARSRLAAPLSEEEARSFWESIEKIGVSLESLQKFIDAAVVLIADERLTATDADEEFADDPRELEQALLMLQDGIETFSRGIRGQSPTAPPSVPDYLDAVLQYRSRVDKVRKIIDPLIPVLPEPKRLARVLTGDEPLAALIGKLRELLNLNVDFLCTALAAREAYRTNLPQSADDAALRIREVIADLGLAAAKIDLSRGDEAARCDTLSESELPDYETLVGSPEENTPLRAIVDALLYLSLAGGPEQTVTVDELTAHAARLGSHRGVKRGLSRGNVYKILNELHEAKLVRKFDANKSKTDKNACHKYRLSIPAQKKRSRHASLVRAEFEDIAALNPAAADPFD